MATTASRTKRRSPIVERRWLAGELRRLRSAAGWPTQGKVAKEFGWPTSKLSMLESALRSVQDDDLERLLALYKVPGRSRSKYLDAGRVARRSEWWDDDLRHSLQDQLRPYTGYEQGSAQLLTYQTALIHGLLQTSEYAAAILRDHPIERMGSNLVDHLVQHRMKRQHALDHPADPLRLHMVIDVAALRRVVGNHDVMRAQLAHLSHVVTSRPNVTVQVIPEDRPSALAAHYGPFTVLEFPPERGPGIVFREGMTDATFLDELTETARYSALFEQLCELALTPDESLQEINNVNKEVHST